MTENNQIKCEGLYSLNCLVWVYQIIVYLHIVSLFSSLITYIRAALSAHSAVLSSGVRIQPIDYGHTNSLI